MVGGFGGDRILGGEGNDAIDGGAAGDSIAAGPGDDIVHGGSGSDDINGGPGNDRSTRTPAATTSTRATATTPSTSTTARPSHRSTAAPASTSLHINPFDQRGGLHDRRSRSSRALSATARSILETPKPHDPTKGKTKLTRDRGGRAKGTERNDTCSARAAPTA